MAGYYDPSRWRGTGGRELAADRQVQHVICDARVFGDCLRAAGSVVCLFLCVILQSHLPIHRYRRTVNELGIVAAEEQNYADNLFRLGPV